MWVLNYDTNRPDQPPYLTKNVSKVVMEMDPWQLSQINQRTLVHYQKLIEKS